MVERISWFSTIDYQIFEFYQIHDITVSPSVLADNIDYHPEYTGSRLRLLRKSGLLNQTEKGYYELSDLGREFLAGDLPVDEVEELGPD
ncbi:phage repressor protein [Halalkalicoccus salilacus]|uniref:phage repressor protein n=1 Tax=Halalkalicoccus salilacus TaxID=3117459 RepID=UPI00300F0F99